MKIEPGFDFDRLDSVCAEHLPNIVSAGFTRSELEIRYSINKNKANTLLKKLFRAGRIMQIGFRQGRSVMGRIVISPAYDFVKPNEKHQSPSRNK